MGACCGEVRTAVKAVIVRDGLLLVLAGRNRISTEEFVTLPGGGQERGETLREALVRECVEEVGVPVVVGRLLYVRDYIGANHEFADMDADAYQTELIFECSLDDGAEPTRGAMPDSYQTGVAWVPLEQLAALNFYPRVLVPLLTHPENAPASMYLGDVN